MLLLASFDVMVLKAVIKTAIHILQKDIWELHQKKQSHVTTKLYTVRIRNSKLVHGVGPYHFSDLQQKNWDAVTTPKMSKEDFVIFRLLCVQLQAVRENYK